MNNNDQTTRELKSLEDGRLRFLKRQQRIEDDQGYGSRDVSLRLTTKILTDLSRDMETSLSAMGSSGKGKSHSSLSILSELEPETLARLTLHGLFNSVGRQDHLQNTLVAIGRSVESELWAKALETYDVDLYARLVARVHKVHGNTKYRLKSIRATAAKAGFKIESWTDDLRISIAGPLLDIALVSQSRVFQLDTEYKGRKTLRCIRLTPEAFSALETMEDTLSWMTPVFSPMVEQPKPWVDFNTGCYHAVALSSRVPLVRSGNKARIALTKQAIASGIMDPCLEALNVIQNTPWSINEKVFEIVCWAWSTAKVIDKFPRALHLPLPERPEGYNELSPAQQKGWRLKRSGVIQRNRGIDAERITVVQDLDTAKDLMHRPFWIPHSLDFRGRVYPVCHFNQQRADYVKGMMHFSQGKPLGDDGAYWLAVHLANCGDFEKVSKKSLDARVSWVNNNHDMIRSIANDPRGTFATWSTADKPFQFLAAVLDFAGYLESGSSHVSHTPVALDGSNSGLQHYSAALRSNEGSLVNLSPSDKPADIYQAVANIVTKTVRDEVDAGDPLAKVVYDQGIGRSLVKRNVMTFAYSSGQYGFKQQLLSDLMDPINLKVLAGELESNPYSVPNAEGEPDGGYRAAGYLAKHTWKAVNHLVHQASDGMRFFQKCAQALAHEAKPLLWYTPVGLPVLHRYDEYHSKRIKLFLHDKSVSVAAKADKVDEEGRVHKQVRLECRMGPNGLINKRKARNAVAPNVIHSLDAAHLMLTVLDGADNNIKSFSLIHDSFGTHAADTEVFFDIIRQAFVNMYQTYDPFEMVRQETEDAIDAKDKVPPLPTKGTLELEGVLDSLYAFA